MRAGTVAVAGTLVAVALTLGCVAPAEPFVPSEAVPGAAWSMTLPVAFDVVLVGTGDRVDPELLLPHLPTTRPVYNLVEFEKTGSVNLEPIQYDVTWRFHVASDEFARAFFAASTAATFEGPVPDFLLEYDHATSRAKRWAHDPAAMLSYAALGGRPSMDYVDAPTVEAWVEQNRAAHGLVFPEPQYTLFVVDSWSEGGLPKDRYHYWYFDDGTIDADLDEPKSHEPIDPRTWHDFHTPKDPTSNRGWGGKWSFAWIDLGAAPSWLDYEPWVPAFEDDNRDHPVWDCVPASELCDEAEMHRKLARHLGDAALVKVVRTPIYDFEYKPRWSFPVHVFVESTAVSGKHLPKYGVDVRTWLGADRIEAAFEDVAPWIDAEVTIEFHDLPTEDPGMARAVALAKAYGNPTIVSAGMIKEHVRAHWDEYVPQADEDTLVFPQFMFFFDGLYTFWGPNQGGGFADGDGWGRPWVAFNHIFDVCVKPEELPCTKATKWQGEGSLDLLVIHEGGHHIGFTHARDTGILDADRLGDEYYANWFWDSTWSVMTYRHQNPGFDGYDRDTIARGHAAWVLDEVARRVRDLPAGSEARVAAEQGIRATEALLLSGAWEDAARSAVATRAALVSAAGPPPAPPSAREVVAFGDRAFRPVSVGTAGTLPVRVEDVFAPTNAWVAEVEVGEGATAVHIAFRDARPEAGALRAAYLVLLDPDGDPVGAAFDDVFAESYVTGLRGPGTYSAVLVTDGGLASEYALTLDVLY